MLILVIVKNDDRYTRYDNQMFLWNNLNLVL